MLEQHQQELEGLAADERAKKEEEQKLAKEKLQAEKKAVSKATLFDATKNYAQQQTQMNAQYNPQQAMQRSGYYQGYGMNIAAQMPQMHQRAYAGHNPQVQYAQMQQAAGQQALQNARAQASGYSNPYNMVSQAPVAPPRRAPQPPSTYQNQQ